MTYDWLNAFLMGCVVGIGASAACITLWALDYFIRRKP